MHELYSWRWSEDGPSIPSCLFLVLQLTPLAGAACRKVPGLAPLPPLPLGPTTDAAKCCDQVAPLSSPRTRKARPHCRGSRLPHGTCRGRSRLCLPGQRRAAGRDRLRPNRRGLQGSGACRPPARTPCFPPRNVPREERQSLAPAARPELSRPTVQVATVSPSAVPPGSGLPRPAKRLLTLAAPAETEPPQRPS